MATRDDLPKVPFHKSLSRVILWNGGDRVLMILSGCVSGYIGFAASVGWGVWVGVPLGGVFLWATISLVVKMTKSDERMRSVFLRARKYKGFYPARGRGIRSRAYKNWVR